jgi:hypothetical protein
MCLETASSNLPRPALCRKTDTSPILSGEKVPFCLAVAGRMMKDFAFKDGATLCVL